MSRRFFLQLLLLQLLALHCGPSNASPLVGIKVKAAKKREFPFMVSLSRRKTSTKKERHFCGGALISKRHVLTAAHCVEKSSPDNVVAILGNVKINLGKSYSIKSWITYDAWAASNNKTSEYKENDIAVVTLEKGVTGIKPAIISRFTPEEVIDKRVVTAGWGYINQTAKQLPDSLQKARLKLLTLPEFEEIMRDYDERIEPLPNNYHTIAYPAAYLGCGDSGGPLLLECSNEIIGVSDSSCDVEDLGEDDGVISSFVVVDYYRDFIDDVAKK